MVINQLRENQRFNKMVEQLQAALSKNQKAKEAIVRINQLEQPIVAHAIAEQIPNILNTLMPDIEAFRNHQKQLAAARKEKKINTPKKNKKPVS